MNLCGYHKVCNLSIGLKFTAMILLEQIQAFNVEDLPVIFTGDFNTVPKSDLYKLLKTKHVETGIGDVNKKKNAKLKHNLWIDSAYYQHEKKEPDCTIKVKGS